MNTIFGYHMIFFLQFGINERSYFFPKSTNEFTPVYLFQIALEIMWLPVLIILIIEASS